MHKLFVCLECEAEFVLRHNMDETHYTVTHCPFCGEELDDEETYHFDEGEDE